MAMSGSVTNWQEGRQTMDDGRRGGFVELPNACVGRRTTDDGRRGGFVELPIACVGRRTTDDGPWSAVHRPRTMVYRPLSIVPLAIAGESR